MGGYLTKGEGNGREFLGKRGGILLNKGVHRGGILKGTFFKLYSFLTSRPFFNILIRN